MKNVTKLCMISVLCLTLHPVQAFWAASAIPHALNPVGTAQAIAHQIREAAQRVEEEARQLTQVQEVMDAQLQALDAGADASDGDVLLPALPGETFRENPAAPEAETEGDTVVGSDGSGNTVSGTVNDGSDNTVSGTVSDGSDNTVSGTVSDGSDNTVSGTVNDNSGEETESEAALPEETETEFRPVEMGASLPSPSEAPAVTTPDGEVDDSVMASRHGTFALPEVDGLNEARINLYDYRMLREYPLSRLPKDLHILYRQLKETVSACEGTWSIYVQNLTTGQALVVNDSSMRSASVMKLFIMETVYEAFDRGDLKRDEDTVYLLRNMIINSSNDSSNRLLSLLGGGSIAEGIRRVNEFIRLHGFSKGTVEYNGFEDPASYVDPSHPNSIMAKDVGLLLSRVYNRTFLSRKVCNEIEQMMLEQGTRYKIPRGLPDGVECGNKSGETETIANDAAVIYGPTTDYILVVLSNDWSDENTANAKIAEISSSVYSFFEH